MQARIFTTNEHGRYVPRTATFGTRLGGITTARPSGEENRGFMGFGVAITGASCWNLSRMEPRERQTLLRQLYTREGLNLSIGRLTVGSSDYSAEVYSYSVHKFVLPLCLFFCFV